MINLTKGDKLYAAYNGGYDSTFQNITATIKEIGKTVIFTDIGNLELDTLQHKKNKNYFVFLTEKDRDNFYEDISFQDKIRSMLSSYNYGKYTLDQLQRISNILNEKK